MSGLWFLIDSLAVYRLTRLVAADTIAERFRSWFLYRFVYDDVANVRPGREAWEGFVECRWCVGVWVAIGVTTAEWAAPVVWHPVGFMLAVACAAPLLARLEDD